MNEELQPAAKWRTFDDEEPAALDAIYLRCFVGVAYHCYSSERVHTVRVVGGFVDLKGAVEWRPAQ